MRPLNEKEWKKLQEIVKKIDEEQTIVIGVNCYEVSYIITNDEIKKISERKIF